jgi:hypothetical protein
MTTRSGRSGPSVFLDPLAHTHTVVPAKAGTQGEIVVPAKAGTQGVRDSRIASIPACAE